MFLLLSGASPRTPSSFATVGSAGGVAQRTKKTSFFSLKCWYYNIVYTYSKIYKAIVFALFCSLVYNKKACMLICTQATNYKDKRLFFRVCFF